MGRLISEDREVTQSDHHMLDQACARYDYELDKRVCCNWVFFTGSLKSTRLHIRKNLLRLVYSLAVSLFWRDCFECDWSLMCGCTTLLGEEKGLCERVQAHTFIQTPGEAESVECRGMPFLDWSSLLLLTGEFCTLHSEHNTWLTLPHQRRHWRMHAFSNSHFLSPSQLQFSQQCEHIMGNVRH